MKIDLAFTPSELEKKDINRKSVVVIDALRATSTMIVAFENGCKAFVPVATVEEARALAEENPDFLLAGERGGFPPKDFSLGNSPRDYRPEKVKGKIVVMTTTNGTRALVASRGGADVLIGSFLNVTAVTRALVARGRDVLIACSGEKDVFCFEDAVCGGAIIEGMERIGRTTEMSDAARSARMLFRQCEADIYGSLCGCDWGRHLEDIGLGDDIPICARVDSSDLVPVYRDGRIFLER
ncbi:MAG TPA: 2-phosphosulfolactate phosphatase [Thermodesulfobacteriota bacterium]|nr:2-phosphosulfolactate phosphatase [Thermodesulfobacteriota bacterium]